MECVTMVFPWAHAIVVHRIDYSTKHRYIVQGNVASDEFSEKIEKKYGSRVSSRSNLDSHIRVNFYSGK